MGPLRRGLTVRLAKAALAGLLLVVVALTPLGASLAGGWFETWLPGAGRGMGSMPTVRVELQDTTGMVRALGPAAGGVGEVENLEGDDRILVATWIGGCGDYLTNLTFRRQDAGYVLGESTDEVGCPFMIGYGRSVAIYLWAPIAAAAVRVIDMDRLGSERERL